MSTMQRCPKCDGELPSAALMGICPKCLGRVVFGIGADEPQASVGSKQGPGDGLTPTVGSRVRYFGDYELQGEIARGGMGVVWRARQLSLDRPVALKMILAGRLATSLEIERFRREAQAAAKLDHPNIVALHEVGEHENQQYFTMQLVEGISLAQILQTRRTRPGAGAEPEPCALLDSPAAAARLIATVAHAVHHAHQRGILHRDIKPGNILVDAAGEPRVTDFGLAKQVDRPCELTQTDTVLGTPHYVSPEQAQGRTALTTATDIYSLGAVLYHLVTGQPVVQANTAWETLRAVVESEPARPRLVNPRLDRDLETICLKCLEKDPQRRYASADALAGDLERWSRGEPILARPTNAWERTLKWVRRKPVVAGLMGALIGAVVLGLVGIIRYASQANLERAKEQDARRDATEKLWASYLAQARANRWSHRPGQRFESLAALSNAAAIRPTLDLRNEAIAALALPDGRVRRYWQLDPPVPLFAGLAFDANVQRYARAYPNGDVAICRARDDTELFRLPGAGSWHEAALCFSPDGRFLAEKHAGQATNFFRVWDLQRRASVLMLPWQLSQLPFAFTPDSAQVAVAREASIHFFDLGSAREIRQFRAPFAPGHLRFDPSGKLLAICLDSDPHLVVLEASSGAVQRTFDATPTGCTWNYRGNLLASTCLDSGVYLWNVTEGKLQTRLAGHAAASMTIVSSVAGDLLASSGWDGSTRFWDSVTGEALFSLPGDLIWFSPPSRDDRLLGFRVGNNHAGIWELAPPVECRRWQVPSVKHASFDASGRMLITAGLEGVSFWEIAERRLVEHIPARDASVVFRTPDGQNLLIGAKSGLERRACAFGPRSRQLTLGPREVLSTNEIATAALSRDGHTLVAEINRQSNLLLLDPERPDKARILEIDARGTAASVSPDGSRCATGNWGGRDVTVWDLGSGKPSKVLPAAMPAYGEFSPDGRYLVVGSSEDYQVFDVNSWQRVFQLPRVRVGGGYGSIEFSPDSRVLGIRLDQLSYVRLLEVGTWKELASLEEGYPLCFSADGSQLATYSDQTKMLMIWDLRRVRRELAAMGLDWESPPLPAEGALVAPALESR